MSNVYDVSVFEPNALTSEAPVDLRLQMNTPLTWGFPEGGFPRGSRSLDGHHQWIGGNVYSKNHGFSWIFPYYGDFPMNNGDFPMKNCDFPSFFGMFNHVDHGTIEGTLW